MIIEIHNPYVETQIKAQAAARGVSVEAFIVSIIEGLNGIHYADEAEDPRIAAMYEAADDELFMADLKEAMEDFKYADPEIS